MLVLAIDTATPAVTAGLVELDPAEPDALRLVASRLTIDSRAHAEVLTPQIVECLAQAGSAASDIDAVVVGDGPGPFTGLRVGMATAAAYGDALSIPVYGVCSLDAIALQTDAAGAAGEGCELLVVTDARRREVYWARYRAGIRVGGPNVTKPSELDVATAEVIAGSPSHVDLFDLAVEPVETPSPIGLVRAAMRELVDDVQPLPLVPRYLRRPDAVEQAGRQR